MKLTEQSKASNVNIGFPLTNAAVTQSQKRAVIRKNKQELLALVQDGECKYLLSIQSLCFNQLSDA